MSNTSLTVCSFRRALMMVIGGLGLALASAQEPVATITIHMSNEPSFEIYGITLAHNMSVELFIDTFGEPDSRSESSVRDSLHLRYDGDGFFLSTVEGDSNQIQSILFNHVNDRSPNPERAIVRLVTDRGYDFSGSPRAAILQLGEPEYDHTRTFLGTAYRSLAYALGEAFLLIGFTDGQMGGVRITTEQEVQRLMQMGTGR